MEFGERFLDMDPSFLYSWWHMPHSFHRPAERGRGVAHAGPVGMVSELAFPTTTMTTCDA